MDTNEKKLIKRESYTLKDIEEKIDEEILEIKESLRNKKYNYKNEEDLNEFDAMTEDELNKRLTILKEAKNYPFFAKIRYNTPTNKLIQIKYIGKNRIRDIKIKKTIVYDWREEISNLYFDGYVGKENKVEGDKYNKILHTKNQFLIEDEKIINALEINQILNNELMIKSLNKNISFKLQDFVPTIKRNQNTIIRAPIDRDLFVQGNTGSGKTTIALKRIAYLIYSDNNDIKQENIIYIGQNKFFLNYISDILPKLGEDKVKLFTIEEICSEILGERIRINKTKEKLLNLVNLKDRKVKLDRLSKMNLKQIELKSSLEYMELIDKFIERYTLKILPEGDFTLANINIISHNEVMELFLKKYRAFPIYERILKIRDYIANLVFNIRLFDIVEGIMEERKREIRKLIAENLSKAKTKTKRCEIFDRNQKLIEKMYKNDLSLLDQYIPLKLVKSTKNVYREFVENFLYDNINNKRIGKFIKENSLSEITIGRYTFDDLPALIYIHNILYGNSISDNIKHIVIDNIEDIGEFQLYALRKIFKKQSMSIFGDINQFIYYTRGINSFEKAKQLISPYKEVQFYELIESFRPSFQNIANNVIRNLDIKERRNIVKLNYIQKRDNNLGFICSKDFTDIARSVAKKIRFYQKGSDIKSIGIICKNMRECREFQKKMGRFITPAKIIKPDDKVYNSNISILPAYLSKGIEFDYVIIVNASRGVYNRTPLDTRFLYLELTRARKKIDIYFIENMTNLLIE